MLSTNYDSAIYAEAVAKIAAVVRRIKAQAPQQAYDLRKASFSEVRNCIWNGQPLERVVIILRSSGCRWARASGGCTMCGHTAAQPTAQIEAADTIEQFASEYRKYDFSKYPVLCLYNNGSFFNDIEMPPCARAGVLKVIAEDPHIEEVVLETRADSITREKLFEVREQLRGKKVVIAMGLETKSDVVRELCIHKGQSLQAFERAAELVKEVLSLRTYVLLKPPFLTEKEAVDDAAESIRYAHSLGGETFVECCTVQGYTLPDFLVRRKLYRPPWLWSIIEVLRQTEPIPVYISPFTYIPLPKDVPHNCARCNEEVSQAILLRYNRRQNRDALDGLDCSCKGTWKAEMAKSDELPLPERILHILSEDAARV